MLREDKLRQADVVTSLILVALGVFTILGALRMPLSGTYGGIPIHWYTSPAVFPLLLGSLLIICSIGVLIRALLAGGHHRLVADTRAAIRGLPANRIARRILLIWTLLLGYVLCLALHPFGELSEVLAPLGTVPGVAFLREPEGVNYVLSSFLLLVLFIGLFHRPRRGRWTWSRLLLLVATCLGVAWAVAYAFTQHLYSPLPW